MATQFIKLVTLCFGLLWLGAIAANGGTLAPVPIRSVTIDDPFWSPKRDIWRSVTIADCFDKFEKDGALTNFDLVRDGKSGVHHGPEWYDGLIYEMITGSADMMCERPDPAIEARIDRYIQRIAAAAAKDRDGYINTYTTMKEPTHRWGQNGGNDRSQHDLYNAGCLVEAAVHYYRATGKIELLQVATRMANHMCDVMGPPPKQNIVPGHALSELAFAELYALYRSQPELKKQMPFGVTEGRYLELAQFWIDNRGHHDGRKSFGAYDQDDRPITQQDAIEGHAVRATLLASGITTIASMIDRDDYRQSAHRLWDSMVNRRMYVTGGVGAVAGDEKFGDDYLLPNNGYLETCAAVGAGFFHERLNLDSGDARYADELERVLFNSALCGVALSGDHYFYENPLEAGKDRSRWSWHACPCCPPMFLKLMGALPSYIYATDAKGIYVNLYVGSRLQINLGEQPISLRQETRYPWEGAVKLTVETEQPTEFELSLRVPEWCQLSKARDALYTISGRPESGAFTVNVNGQPASMRIARGYARITRRWTKGDVIDISMQMPPRRVFANEKVKANAGKVAISRGPIIYCIESIDNGGQVRNLALPDESRLEPEYRPDLLAGVTIIKSVALTATAGGSAPESRELIAIPYYANANRGPASMAVWIPRTIADATPIGIAGSASTAASHTFSGDTLDALNDGRLPKRSDDESLPRFTWWDHRGTHEWVQYSFDRPTPVSAISVYWWDERRVKRHCRTPESWRLMYRTGRAEWSEVPKPSGYGVEMDAPNRVTFEPVTTTAIRIEAQLRPDFSAGILEWQIESPAAHASNPTAAGEQPGAPK